MKELKLEQISYSVGAKKLFSSLDFMIHTGEKIGLIGQNGTGKSTFLKLVAGDLQPQEGRRTLPGNLRIAYLEQSPKFPAQSSILDVMFSYDTPVMQAVHTYEDLLAKLSEDAANETLQKKFERAESEMNRLNAWQADTQAKYILNKLGITDIHQKIGELSGGQLKRVALAQVLISDSDLLLLDEPTNHLDFSMIQWLENFLENYTGAVLLVTHDRYFLDRVATEINELESGQLVIYPGNYQKYIELKDERERSQTEQRDRTRQLYKQELAWMRDGVRARGTRQKARVERFEELKKEAAMTTTNNLLTFDFPVPRLGKQVFELEHATFSYPGRAILDDFNLIIGRRDRIGITGRNGSGKSTFLNILAGNLLLDTGILKTGETVRIGYFKQEFPVWSEDKRVIEYLQEAAHSVNLDGTRHLNLTQLLEQFLFPKAMHGARIRTLSGGEKRRLYLVRLLIEQPNVLLLDEPTNDLDLDTLRVLENFIEKFPGAVITVSHDRYFLDKTSDHLFVFNGEAQIDEHFGLLSDYKEKQTTITSEKNKLNKEESKNPTPAAIKTERIKTHLTYMEKKEWESIESEIEELEERLTRLSQRMVEVSDKSGEQADYYVELIELQEEHEHVEMLLLEKIARWDYLSEFV